jgi:heme-degrading monooxygenase HmoA
MPATLCEHRTLYLVRVGTAHRRYLGQVENSGRGGGPGARIDAVGDFDDKPAAGAVRASTGAGPASTPAPPYTAVIFTSVMAAAPADGYEATAAAMELLAQEQPGYLGVESARDAGTGAGITVSYWATDDDARAWKRVADHAEAQRRGRQDWYERYRVRVASVTREYGTG